MTPFNEIMKAYNEKSENLENILKEIQKKNLNY